MKKLLHTTVIIGSAQVLVILLQIVRIKIIALIIGPEGIGVLGNTLAFIGLLENICLCGLHIALLRYSSEGASKKKFNQVSKLFSTTVIIHLFVSTSVILCSLLFLKQINVSIYRSQAFLSVSIFALLSLPFMILRRDFANLFNAFNKVKLLGKIKIYAALSGLATIVPLIYYFGLKGAIFSIFAAAVIMFSIIFCWYKKYLANIIKIKKSFFLKRGGARMFKFAGAHQASLIIHSLSAYLLRVFVTAKFLLAGAGIFNAAMSIGGYLLLTTSPLQVYYYPKLSSIYKNGRETKTEVNNVLRFFLILLTPAIVCILLFADIVIKLLLTDAFLPVRTILLWILIAKFFEILKAIVGLPLWVMEKFKISLSVVTIFNFILVGLSYILLKNFGLIGMAFALTIAYGLLFIFWSIASFKVFGFRIKTTNILLLITSLALFGLANWLGNYNLVARIFALVVLSIWLLMVVKKREWVTLFGYLKNKLKI